MRHLNFILVSLIIVLCCGILSSQPTIVSTAKMNHPYIHPTPGEITIMAINPTPQDIEPTKQSYIDVINCGFNLVSMQGTLDFYKRQFQIIDTLNLKYLISNGLIANGKALSFVEALKDYPQFGGYIFKDEPRYENLQALKESYDKLYAEDSSHFIYFNLISGINKVFTGPFTKYPDYLDYIQNMFQPQMWSNDYYPIFNNNGKISVTYGFFYNNFENLRNISKATDRPFWAFCQSMAFKTKYVDQPAATEAYLRFEAFTALAYGAQGIVYWTYGQRKSTETETYSSALVNLNGKKTKAWYAAQKINNEIKRYNDVFFEGNVIDLKHSGKVKYTDSHITNGTFGPFKNITHGDAGFILSHIIKDSTHYIMIISRDVTARQNLKFNIDSNLKIIDITDNNKTYSDKETFSCTLDKAGYRIFKIS